MTQARFSPLQSIVENERDKVATDQITLYTIGYEGLSIEQTIERLMQRGVSVLVDVRHTPFSMKVGFSKNQLQHITGECKMEYCHLPKLGIEHDQRKNLVRRSDYEQLFERYRNNVREKENSLQEIQNLLQQHSHLALTCFERDHQCCHQPHRRRMDSDSLRHPHKASVSMWNQRKS